MLWLILRRTTVLLGCVLLAITLPIGAMLARDWRFAHAFASAHPGAGGEPVTYQSVYFFLSPSWQAGLLMLSALLGLCLLLTLLRTLLAKRRH